MQLAILSDLHLVQTFDLLWHQQCFCCSTKVLYTSENCRSAKPGEMGDSQILGAGGELPRLINNSQTQSFSTYFFIIVCWFGKGAPGQKLMLFGGGGGRGLERFSPTPPHTSMYNLHTCTPRSDVCFKPNSWPNFSFPVTPQYTLATDAFQLGYTEDGHCKGEVDRSLPPPQRLGWEIPAEVSAPCLLKSSAFTDLLLAATSTSTMESDHIMLFYWQKCEKTISPNNVPINLSTLCHKGPFILIARKFPFARLQHV